MCLKYHPDKLKQKNKVVKSGEGGAYDKDNAYQQAKETFLKVQEAFEVLSDQATRRQW